MDGNVIASTESIKDLGIVVDYSLKFHSHTTMVTARANRVLAMINKSFEYLICYLNCISLLSVLY